MRSETDDHHTADAIVQRLRLSFPGQPNAKVLPWRTSRSQLKPAEEDGHQLPAVFAVLGRQTQQHFIEFGIDANDPLPGIDLAVKAYEVQIDVLLGHKKKWKRLLTFPLKGKQIDSTKTIYIAYANDAFRS